MNAKKSVAMSEWERRLSDVSVSKADLNRLVMNYLVIEGYRDAAEALQKESGTDPMTDLSNVSDRMAIRAAIQRGDVEEGIAKVNDLEPRLLDSNPTLFFHLQQQRLIELIRKGQIAEALKFAQEELAPQGEDNHAFLEELERTMALLAFEDASASPVGRLLDYTQRQKTAGELNTAILASQAQEKEPRLPALLRILTWGQTQLDEKLVYPHINSLMAAKIEEP
eukprot:TRINITY_DN13688_c0_g1_i3.p1 TRINITY_DN13688_c0_g1~~TRINITY_DN13688_c0_g1_i3.p1  ORF type:complete len:224 (-),score=71.20 TRINITY_DN13688_c0_g1_i3:66-737(-)